MKEWIAGARKFLAASAVALAALASSGLVPDDYLRYVMGALAVVQAVAVYVARNAPDPAAVDAAAEAKLNAAPSIDGPPAGDS